MTLGILTLYGVAFLWEIEIEGERQLHEKLSRSR